MSSVILTGDSSGSVTLTVPSAAGSNTITMPAATGTASLMGSGTAVSASGTSVDFTGIPSWVKKITVMFNGVSTNGSSNIQVQLGDSGGIETTGYLSAGSRLTTTAQAGTSTTGLLFTAIVVAANVTSGIMTIVNLSGNIWAMNCTTSDSANSTVNVSGGTKETSATLDRVRITTVNGTDAFDAGTINVMWEG
jgi:hypothetical protein